MKRKTVIQEHHITYIPERKVKVWQGEHWLLSLLGRRKNISEGFIEALEQWISDNRGKVVKLE